MNVTITGPNAHGGGFHVHLTGCRDLSRRPYRDIAPLDERYEEDHECRQTIVEGVYADHEGPWEHYESEFRFFPCLAGLPRTLCPECGDSFGSRYHEVACDPAGNQEDRMPADFAPPAYMADEDHDDTPPDLASADDGPRCRYCGLRPGLGLAAGDLDPLEFDLAWDGDGDVCVACFEDQASAEQKGVAFALTFADGAADYFWETLGRLLREGFCLALRTTDGIERDYAYVTATADDNGRGRALVVRSWDDTEGEGTGPNIIIPLADLDAIHLY